MGLLTGRRLPFRRRSKVKLSNEAGRATTLPLDRPLSAEEHAIAEWLLCNASTHGASYLPQLDSVRVTGQCSCGCPTVDIKISSATLPADPVDNPVADAVGEVDGKMVGVMLLQSGGYLACLEVYDLSDIERPYGLPDLRSLKPFG
jgi:hypothetical protein